ncbi:hypothetical protein VaNZ11_014001 [Volvox africanus]|uniref:Uncharacterized protein n=1 Tax=Volvox africanus TaxID=51714 RepID=A0ABQ5SIT7_9CHLO|nr:hypothetical protein VaNZ11_014001 [Volvox africanus]
MARPTSNMVLLGAAVLLMLSTLCKAAPVTACPSKTGYDALPDWTCNPIRSSDRKVYSSLAAAEAVCKSNSTCVCFNSAGEVFFSNDTQGRSQRGCAYVKQVCAPKSGYETLGKVKISTSKQGGGKENTVGSANAAESACNADSKCLAFNDAGLYITKILIVDSATTTTSCAYKKALCTNKYGFKYKKDSNFKGLSGLRGVKKDKMSSAAAAESFCKITPKCTAWNSKGEYVIGGVQGYESESDVCTYVKQPCPPVPGFTAYYGLAVNQGIGGAPVSTESGLCFSDIKTMCTNDPNCLVFDTLRNIWRTDVEPTKSFPGMCTYRRVAGF